VQEDSPSNNRKPGALPSVNKLPGGVGVFEIGEKVRATYFSKGLSDLFGFSRTEYVSDMDLDLEICIEPTDLVRLRSAIQSACKTLAPIDIEIRPIRTSSVRWVRLQGKFTRYRENRPVYYFVASDISSAKENSLQLEKQNAKLSLLLANSTFEMWEVNLRTWHVSTLTKTILGGHDPLEFDDPVSYIAENQLVHPDYQSSIEEDFRSLANGVVADTILKVRCRDNVFRFLKLSYSFVGSEEGGPGFAIGIFQDVNDEIEARLSVLGDDSLFFAAFELESGKPILSDQGARELMGPERDVYGFFGQAIQKNVHPIDHRLFMDISNVGLLKQIFEDGKKEYGFECRISSPNRTYKGYHWCQVTVSIANSMSKSNQTLFVGIKDIHRKKTHEMELVKQARRDSLTGLLNRYSLEELTNKTIADSMQANLLSALLIIDIDNFKSINDCYGHDYGDKVLKTVARLLKSLFSPKTILSRLGGDELLVCIPSVESEKAAYDRGLEICRRLARKQFPKGKVSCSVGVSVSPIHGTAYADLYQKADLALYKAKQQGRNKCCIYDGIDTFPRQGKWISHKWLLDNMEETVFLCDIETKELIFINKTGKERLGNNGNYLGAKCYEVLFECPDTCAFCTVDKLSSEAWISWNPPGGWQGKPYRFREKLVYWNGRPAVLGIAKALEERKQEQEGTFPVENEVILDLVESASLASWDYCTDTGSLVFNFTEKGQLSERRICCLPDKEAQIPWIHADDAPRFFDLLREERTSPGGKSMDIRIDFRETGSFCLYRLSCFAIADRKGSISRIGGQLTNLSPDLSSDSLLPCVVNALPVPMITFSCREGNPVMFANDRFFESIGYDRAEYAQRFGNDALALIDPMETKALVERAHTGPGSKTNIPLRVAHKSYGWITMQATVIVLNRNAAPVLSMVLREQEVVRSMEQDGIFRNFKEMISVYSQGIALFSLDKGVVTFEFANDALSHMLGGFEQTNPLPFFDPMDGDLLLSELVGASWPDPPEDLRIRMVKKDGSNLFVSIRCKYFETFGQSIYFYLEFHEISPYTRSFDSMEGHAAEHLEYALSHCLLTGLYSRQRFFEKTGTMLEARADASYAMVFWNIERFAVLNELLGIESGNLILKTLAARIRGFVGETGTYARLESDHFAACIPVDRCDPETLQKSVHLDDLMERLNFSISLVFGLYVIEDYSMPVPLMCDRAMLAMKSTKGNFMQNFAYYKKVLSSTRIDEQSIVSEMRDALKNGEFCFYLQPIYGLEEGTINSAEALVRWNHPKRGLLYPQDFIPIFERFGFITSLDLYVWDQVCTFISSELEAGHRIVPISVNLSRLDLCDRNLGKLLIETAKRHDVTPSLLELEVTETAYMDNPSQMKEMVKILQEHGFTILMDDFGTGYSSLHMLKSIPMDIVKVDQNFLHSLGEDERAGKILETIVSLGKALRFPIIAEGVETAEQLRYLKEIGCDHVQGFYCSRPLTTREFRLLLDS
jgi:diguanylate cyclase (GGDEF)-like protein